VHPRRRGIVLVLGYAAAALLVGDGIALAAVKPAKPRVTLNDNLTLLVPATTTTAAAGTVVNPSQAIVTGVVSSAHLVGAVNDPLPFPLTVTIPNRGQGELDISGVVVDGSPGGTVAWDGGQPLPLSGTGSLDLGPDTVDVDAAGITWHLDGTPRSLTPGAYLAESSVAVGTAGLAQPLDRAPFSVAAGRTGQLVSVGDAQVHLPPRPELFHGPGIVQLLGTLTVKAGGTTRTVTDLQAATGPFELQVSPGPGGYAVQAVLGGPLRSSVSTVGRP
jgi:hypothetical protein